MHNLLCPGKTNGFNREVASFVIHENDLSGYNWSTFIPDKLVSGIRKAQSLAISVVFGCVVLLMIVYLEHLSVTGPRVGISLSPQTPWVAQWREEEVGIHVAKLKSMHIFGQLPALAGTPDVANVHLHYITLICYPFLVLCPLFYAYMLYYCYKMLRRYVLRTLNLAIQA
ncbi:unnamed protein product [Coffea canephora]|uniref:DH200=94 genomic scaffold, scaffold_212 n=1 Tax=Coffea canephora TaxID=49390 RepID=A0A068VBB7_COFCA|nr:unnamed protein product [Coffea canephora]